MKKNKKFLYTIIGFIIFCLILLITDRRVLVYEEKVYHEKTGSFNPKIIDPFEGTIKALNCTYFTGRTFVTTSFWYASNNIMGKDSCPFLTER
jgi:hypothetical protein